jgi:alpha-galactosidase
MLAGSIHAAPPLQQSAFTLAGIPVTVEGDLGPFELSVTARTLADGVEVATLRLEAAAAERPPAISLRWSIPTHDIYGQWNTGARFSKAVGPSWGPSRVSSMLARHAPVMALFGADDGNRLTFAVSDALNTVDLTVGLREEDARIYGGVELFGQRHRPIQAVEIELRFDVRLIPLAKTLADVSAWWAGQPGFEPAPVPELARLPMYSTWYSYHQNVSAPELLIEVERAKALGYEAIIVDDGWQTLDSRRGYAYTGDWRPERMPEMRAFADAVHDRGMKLMLWYSLPLVGEKSAAYPRFEGKYLRYWDGQGAWVLDPRYPETRAHIIDTYRRAMNEWGIDGFKLDFLGFLVATEATELTAEAGRDYASVNEATDRLMTDIMAQLRAINPEILIEFRQPYIGPLMRKYGNMFRAGDAPDAAVDNRVRVTDLRLLSGSTAVHSDMLMWHYDEPVEVAALQMLNILFSVPQLSVRLADIPADHRQMAHFWTAYWRDNRDVLLDGRFEPTAPMANYPMVAAHNARKRIVALYQDMIAVIPDALPAIDVVNATAATRVVLEANAPLGDYSFTVRDTRGQAVDTGRVSLESGVHAFDVPPAGLLSLERR